MTWEKEQVVWVLLDGVIREGRFLKNANDAEYCVVLFPKDQIEMPKSRVFNAKKEAIEKFLDGKLSSDICDLNRTNLIESIECLESGQSLNIASMTRLEEPCIVRVEYF